MMEDPRAQRWLTRARSAWSQAAQMRQYYERVAEMFYPERMEFYTRGQSDGRDNTSRLFDGEAVLLRQELADGFGGMLRPRSQDWFYIRAKPLELNDDASVQMWLDHANERLREALYRPRTRFETAMRDNDHDFVTFGVSFLSVTLNRARDGFLFRCPHPRDMAFELDDEDEPSILYEELRLTPLQAEALFRGVQLPRHILEAVEQARRSGTTGSERRLSVWRVICPREEHEWRQQPPSHATVASLYIDPVTGQFLAEAHMRVNPYQVRRWQTVVSGEVWGRSPCTAAALADARTLNTAQRALLEGLEKAIDPPMGASDKVLGSEINLYAGGVTYLGDVDDVHRHFRPIQDGARVDYGLQFTQERRQFLSRAMRQNLLRLPEEREMTAYEASQRVEEWIRNAAPVFEPMQAFNADLMERVFSLALYDINNRAGLFDPPPEQLGEITWEFEDRLAEAKRKRKLYRTREFEQEMTTFAQVASGGDPQMARQYLALVDWNEVLAAKREAYPAKWFKAPEQATEDIERIEMEQGGQRLLEMAQNAPPELLQMGLAQLEGATGEIPTAA